MVRVTAFIRPHKLEAVKTALADLGVGGMSVGDVRGTGNSPETASIFAGEEVVVALPIRAKLQVVAVDDLLEAILEAIVANARTGEPGDGKIFVERLLDAWRIRTEERGDLAL